MCTESTYLDLISSRASSREFRLFRAKKLLVVPVCLCRLKPKNIPAIMTMEKISGSQTCSFLFFISLLSLYFDCKIQDLTLTVSRRCYYNKLLVILFQYYAFNEINC